MSTHTRATDALALGTIGRPHGVRGETTLRPYDPAGDGLAQVVLPAAVDLVPKGMQTRLAKVLTHRRRVPDGWLVRFEGVPSREDVAKLTGAQLCVSRALLPPLSEGEFYLADLVGALAVSAQGDELGRVHSLFWNGAQDVMSVRAADGAERLFPLVPEFVQSFDAARRRVVLDTHE